MAKMKFDFKQFVMQKGERVGLGLALSLTALLFVWGVLGALSATSPAKDLSQAADQLNAKVNVSGGGGKDEPKPPPTIKEWHPGVDADRLRMTQLFDPMGAGNPKRGSPVVLPVGYELVDDPASPGKKYPVAVCQMDVVYAGGKIFSIDGTRIDYHRESNAKTVVSGGNSGGMIGPNPGGTGGMQFGGRGGGKMTTTSDKKYVEKMLPLQMVVVSATFPVKQQLEQISKALRYDSLQEMFEAGGADAYPEFGGLVVFRREMGADGKASEWVDLKLDDKNGPTMKLYARLKGFESEDEEQSKHIFPGLVMPRPYSLTVEYPLVKLPDIPPGEAHPKKIREEEKHDQKIVGGSGSGMIGPTPGGKGPGGMGPGVGGRGGRGGGVPGAGQGPSGAKHLTYQQDFKELPKEYEGPDAATQDKFERRFDIFEPGGFPREPTDDKAPTVGGGAPVPGGGGKPFGGIIPPRGGKGGGRGPGDGDPGTMGPGGVLGGKGQGPAGATGRFAGPGLDKMPETGLVRFVDVNVKPGHTYQYMVKVRLRNPNHKKKAHEVASAGLVKKEFVESPFVFTPAVKVGQEIHFYAVDQRLAEEPAHYRQHHLKGASDAPAGGQFIAMQVHRFLKEVKDHKGFKKEVSDWAVAERILVPRGEYVGQPVEVELPYWNDQEEDFDLINGKMNPFTKHRYTANPLWIDFSTRNDPESRALVVDFRGGNANYGIESSLSNQTRHDEAATELLIMTEGGKLEIRHSRFDTDPQYPRAAERAARVEHMRQRVHDVKQPPTQQTNPMSGGKGGGPG